MKLEFSPADEAFRLEVREFVRQNLPADIRRKVELGLRLEHQDYVTWFRILESRGWLTPGWPVEQQWEPRVSRAEQAGPGSRLARRA